MRKSKALSHNIKTASTAPYSNPPKQVINDRLVPEAKRLLINSDKPVKEISFDPGFGEPTNFNQLFKKNVPLIPMEWRTGL